MRKLMVMIILRERLSQKGFSVLCTKKEAALILPIFFLWKWEVLFDLKFPSFQSPVKLEDKQSVQVVEYTNNPMVTNMISIFLGTVKGMVKGITQVYF